jgi:hypothetical protein
MLLSNDRKAIYFHEYSNKKHPHKSDLSTRQKVADSFEQFKSKVASEFVNKLQNHNAARGIILG